MHFWRITRTWWWWWWWCPIVTFSLLYYWYECEDTVDSKCKKQCTVGSRLNKQTTLKFWMFWEIIWTVRFNAGDVGGACGQMTLDCYHPGLCFYRGYRGFIEVSWFEPKPCFSYIFFQLDSLLPFKVSCFVSSTLSPLFMLLFGISYLLSLQSLYVNKCHVWSRTFPVLFCDELVPLVSDPDFLLLCEFPISAIIHPSLDWFSTCS